MKSFTHIVLLLVCSIAVSACQSTEQSQTTKLQVNKKLYHDEAFLGYAQLAIESEQEVFAIDDEMKNMVANKLSKERDISRRAKKLLKHIFAKDSVDIAYQSGANLTAIDAYHSHTANCMSLTIMAYVLAKEAKLDVSFQDVKVPEYWVRNGQYNMLTGHVNLVITKPKTPDKSIFFGQDIIQIDFDPYVVKRAFPKKVIEKHTVLAMFYNNKGAQALVDQHYNLAYAYFKQATLVAPSFSSAWGNLGILYKLTNHIDFAFNSYRYAIKIDNENFTALENLSFLLKEHGSEQEFQLIQETLNNKRIINPYYHALLADEAFFRGENKLALKHYKKALKLDNKVHEFYFGLAKVYYKLSDISRAKRAMKKAILYNRATSTENLYTAKLNLLNVRE